MRKLIKKLKYVDWNKAKEFCINLLIYMVIMMLIASLLIYLKNDAEDAYDKCIKSGQRADICKDVWD